MVSHFLLHSYTSHCPFWQLLAGPLLHPPYPSLAALLALSTCLWCHPPVPVSCVCCHTAMTACATALWPCPQLPFAMVSGPIAWGSTHLEMKSSRWVCSVLCAPESAGIACSSYPCLFGQLVPFSTVLRCCSTCSFTRAQQI